MMLDNQDLGILKERFDIWILKLDSVGIEMDDFDAAHAFMERLNSNFDELRTVQRQMGMYPGAKYQGARFGTVEQAFAGAQAEVMSTMMAGTTKKTVQSEWGRTGAVFAGRASRGGGRSGRGGRDGRGSGRGRGDSAREENKKKKKDHGCRSPRWCGMFQMWR